MPRYKGSNGTFIEDRLVAEAAQDESDRADRRLAAWKRRQAMANHPSNPDWRPLGLKGLPLAF